MTKIVLALAVAVLIAPVAFANDNETADTAMKSETTKVTNDADAGTKTVAKHKKVVKSGKHAKMTKEEKSTKTAPSETAPAEGTTN